MSASILVGECRAVLATLPEGSLNCAVTSPPYWGLRDYGHPDQLGLEATPAEYVAKMVDVFRAIRRVLRPDGTAWLNLGDTYATGGGKVGNCPGGGEQGARWRGDSRGSSVSRLVNTNGGTVARPKTSTVEGVARGPMTQPNRLPIPGLKPKDLIGVPWLVAFALQADGWYLRSEIIWHKPNGMPSSITDRPGMAHEKVFLLSMRERYYYDADAIREPLAVARDTRLRQPGLPDQKGSDRANGGAKTNGPMKAVPPRRSGNKARDIPDAADGRGIPDDGVPWQDDGTGRNARSVWTIPTQPFRGAHFATMPPELARRCILAGCPAGGTVLDPFAGAGTTGLVADRLGRNSVLVEINPEYARLADERIRGDAPLFAR